MSERTKFLTFYCLLLRLYRSPRSSGSSVQAYTSQSTHPLHGCLIRIAPYSSTRLRFNYRVLQSPFAGNPLVCSCSSHPQKTWLRQHRKWLSTEQGRGSKAGPRCAQPEALAGRHLLTVKVLNQFRNLSMWGTFTVKIISLRIPSCARSRPSSPWTTSPPPAATRTTSW